MYFYNTIILLIYQGLESAQSPEENARLCFCKPWHLLVSYISSDVIYELTVIGRYDAWRVTHRQDVCQAAEHRSILTHNNNSCFLAVLQGMSTSVCVPETGCFLRTERTLFSGLWATEPACFHRHIIISHWGLWHRACVFLVAHCRLWPWTWVFFTHTSQCFPVAFEPPNLGVFHRQIAAFPSGVWQRTWVFSLTRPCISGSCFVTL